jgi:hypothetical protein
VRIELDTTLQISGFSKLKLAKCAPIPGPPVIGFFACACQMTRPAMRDAAPSNPVVQRWPPVLFLYLTGAPARIASSMGAADAANRHGDAAG